MRSDRSQGSALESLTPDSKILLSLALDAYLVGYTQVAQDLTALADKLNESGGCSRFGIIARAILVRANEPGQWFDTLLDPFDLSEASGQCLPNGPPSQGSADTAQQPPVRNPKPCR